jgi:hypothetical protein
MNRSLFWTTLALLGLAIGGLLAMRASTDHAHAAVRMPDRPASVEPAAAQREPPQVLYARAARYEDCAQQAERDASPTPPFEPAEAVVADVPTQTQTLHEACRRIGPAQYAEVRRLMQAAAASGDASARVYLLQQRAGALLERLSAAAGETGVVPLTIADRHEADLIVAELEELAFAGQRDAMQTLQQVMDARVLASSEPVYAAAWRLAAEQPAGHPLSPDAALLGEEELETLDPSSEQQVVVLARELHARCCAR